MRLTSSIAVAALLAGLSSPALAVGSLTKIVPGTDSSSSEASPSSEAAPATSSEAPDTSSSAEPDQAAGPLVSAEDPQSVLSELSVLGYPGKLGKTDDGHPSIALRIAGYNTYIDFYDCADDMTKCYTLLFNVNVQIKGGTTPGKVNDWNRKQILGRVWLDDDGNPTLDFTLPTFEGISASVFDESVKDWADAIDDFKTAFDLR